MEINKRILILTLVLGYLFASIPILADTVSKDEAAEEFVNKFCNSEFTGVEERFDFIKYSPEREAIERESNPNLMGMVIFWDGDPIYVVSSYNILNVAVSGNKGVATVAYQLLARSLGEGPSNRRLILDFKENDIVKLNLIKENNRWFIIDPPIPRISKKALIDYYEAFFNSLGDKWIENPKLTLHQRKFYNKQKESLEFLKKIEK